MCFNGLTNGRTTTSSTPASILIEHLDLEPRQTAEVEDMYSRPIRTVRVLPLVTGEHRVPQFPAADAA